MLSWKPRSNTSSECVFVALVIQHAMRIRHILLSHVASVALPCFFTLSHKRHNFWKSVTEYKISFDFLYKFIWNISPYKKNSARYDQKRTHIFTYDGRHSSQILIKCEFSRQTFEKYANIKFHENPSSQSRLVPCGQANRYDEAFRNSANALCNIIRSPVILYRQRYTS